jgi:transcriptional regulator with XRE-family HTH domain
MINPQQILFFQSIKSALPEYQNLSQSIAEELGISTNEAYKKIRGESNLNLNQIIKLSDSFDVPFLYHPKKSLSVTFNYLNVNENLDMITYLHNLLNNLKAIKKAKQKHITITTDDIPLFHFFKYPELTSFKLFFWANSSNSIEKSFETSFISEEIVEISKELYNTYLEIPSTEIWSKDTVTGTLEQIRYCFEAGQINKEQAEQITEQVKYCLTDMNMYATGSKKTIDPTHTFTWYHCDVLGSIAYLVNLNDKIFCYNRFNTFNYLKTEDYNYCLQTKNWMQGLIQKSTSFSGQGEKHRNKFMYNAFGECDKLIREINN